MNLTEYMSDVIEKLVYDILRATLKNPRESGFILKYMISQKNSAKKRNKLEAQGKHIPPFLIASIASQCNLFCKGCYARANQSCGEHIHASELTSSQWEDIFHQASDLGVSFILLAGGEPLLRRDVIEAAVKFEDIIFPVFTNGTMIDKSYINLFDKSRNIVPVLSIEGSHAQTDERRGEGTYESLMRSMEQMSSKGMFFGVSVTVTTENLDSVTDSKFINILTEKGCKLVFYVEYVPVEGSTLDLAFGDEERKVLEERLKNLREQYKDMIFLSFPGDEKDTGGCLAAGRGFFHINAVGGAEPCPFAPYSDVNLKDYSLLEALQSPLFQKLSVEGFLSEEHKGGCVLFEKLVEIKELLGNQ